jgi:hypothetical protein
MPGHEEIINPEWGWDWIFQMSHESALIETAIEAAQVAASTARRYTVLDYWIQSGRIK